MRIYKLIEPNLKERIDHIVTLVADLNTRPKQAALFNAHVERIVAKAKDDETRQLLQIVMRVMCAECRNKCAADLHVKCSGTNLVGY